jgi:hypothetical protein
VPTGQLVDGWLSTSCATRRSCSNNLDGRYRHPERFSRHFSGQVVQARKALGEERLPVIRLHDLPHTHATLLLADGVPVEVVAERLGHASATITLTVYQHVHPGMGCEAADRFAALLEADSRREAPRGYHEGHRGPYSKTPRLLACRNTRMRLCPRGDTPHTHTPAGPALLHRPRCPLPAAHGSA